MTVAELKDIAKSYGLVVEESVYWIDILFEDNPEFWDCKDYSYPHKLIAYENNYITVYTKLRKTKSGKFVIINQRTYNINNYTTRKFHNLIKRIQKQIKIELIAKRLNGIKQDF
jgi:hypothetical protein